MRFVRFTLLRPARCANCGLEVGLCGVYIAFAPESPVFCTANCGRGWAWVTAHPARARNLKLAIAG